MGVFYAWYLNLSDLFSINASIFLSGDWIVRWDEKQARGIFQINGKN